MGLFGKSTAMVNAASALPGRSLTMPVPATHYENGHRIVPPFPDGMQLAQFAMVVSGGAERAFWELPGVYSTAVGYAGGYTPNSDHQEVCSGQTGHTEMVLVVYDRTGRGYGELLKTFWEAHDPTQGMRQGNDIGSQYRLGDLPLRRRTTRAGRRHARAVPGGAGKARIRRNHHRSPWRQTRRGDAGVLLRRGISPAISGEKPGRVLRFGRTGASWCAADGRNSRRLTAEGRR